MKYAQIGFTCEMVTIFVVVPTGLDLQFDTPAIPPEEFFVSKINSAFRDFAFDLFMLP